MSDEWGEWQLHDGKGCPLSAGVIYETQAPCGCCLIDVVDEIDLYGIDWHPAPEDRVCNQCHAVWPQGGFLSVSEALKMTPPTKPKKKYI